MESISGDLERAEVKKKSLFQAYEQMQSEVSSLLSFTLSWKDLEEHFDGIRQSLERRAKALDEGERSLAERARDVATREDRLESAQQRAEEEFRRKTADLRSVEQRLETCKGECREEGRQLVVTRDALKECLSLVKEKKKELSSLTQSTEERRRDCDSRKEEVEVLRRELDSKEKKVGAVQSLLKENARELAAKVEELGSVKCSLDECSRKVISTREELTKVQSMLDQSFKAHDESEKRLSVLDRTIDVRDKEVTVKAEKLRSLEDKINDSLVELKMKEEELKRISESIEERSKELESKELQLHSMDILIEEHKEELKSKEEHFEGITRLINERSAALALKDGELGSIEISIGKLSKELKYKEGELENLIRRVKQSDEETGSKKEDLASVQAKLEEVAKSLELKSGEFSDVQASIKDSNLKLASKERELESIQIDITKRAEQLQLKEKEYAFIQSSILECTKDLELKKNQCVLMRSSITECFQELESKKRQLDSIQKRSSECFTDVALKEKHLHMLEVSIEEHSQTLETMKKECNMQCSKLELGRQQLNSTEKSLEKLSKEMESIERTHVPAGVVAQNWKHPLINGPVLASCQNFQPAIASDVKNFQMLLYRHFQEHNRLCQKVLEIIQKSADAAKLILDAMEGFHPSDSRNRDRSPDIGLIQRSCIFLLENLILSSAEIKPQDREAAHKLAVEWKVKLKVSPSPAHPLEVLGFLRLIVAYKLASAFDANEIQELANSLSQFQIAQELHEVIGSPAVPPGSRGLIQHWQIKTEEPENIALLNGDGRSVANPPPPTVLAVNDLQLVETELSPELAMIYKDILHTLQNSSDPAILVLDFMTGSYSQYSKCKDISLRTDVVRCHIAVLELLVRLSPSITHEVKERAIKMAREWKAKLSGESHSCLEAFAFQRFLAAYNLVSLFNDAPLSGQTLGLVNEVTAPASTPPSLSRVQQQPPREKKRLAGDPAIDVQSHPSARKCKYKLNNQGGLL